MKAAHTLIPAFCALAFLYAFTGCGGSRESQNDLGLVWPPPPDEPRVRYVRTLQGENDFGGGIGGVLKTLAGESGKVGLTRPFDVCVDDRGMIFVTDVAAGVIVFDMENREVRRFAEDSPVSLQNPRGIAYDDGKVFISLADLGQVVVFDRVGEFLYSIGRAGQFPGPVDVACDTVRNRLLIVDNKLHQLLVYSYNGDSLFTIGKRGEAEGEFNFPQSVAADGGGTIYVMDRMNFRIQIFDSSGTFLRMFGKQGNVFGTFGIPKGIALDTYGNIYALDANHDNFQIFNQQGELLMFVGKFSTGNDGFQNPVSITIDRKNNIYVTDQLNKRLQVFQLIKGD